MEDRLTTMPTRAALAIAALLGIILITAGMWALALWPLDPSSPEWIVRTRAICFGAQPEGLPHAGGWVLLIGEPVGMLLFLAAAWGFELREGLNILARRWSGRALITAVIALVCLGAGAATARVRLLAGERFDTTGGRDVEQAVMAINDKAPVLGLVSQQGEPVTVESLQGRPAVISFVYAHCETICPVMVYDVLAATKDRATAVLVTLDPWRDTPARLPSIARAWNLPEGALVLSGDVDDVEFVLDRWKVPRVRNQSTGDLIHPAVAYVLDANGRLRFQTDASREALTLALGQL